MMIIKNKLITDSMIINNKIINLIKTTQKHQLIIIHLCHFKLKNSSKIIINIITLNLYRTIHFKMIKIKSNK
jgi:hypothetical protein